MPLAGGVPGLLEQLAPCGVRQRLARDVAQPGRDLPQLPGDRVPVLADHQHPVLVVEREDADGADMGDHGPLGLVAVRHAAPCRCGR